MKITTTSRHYELTPALKEYAEAKIQNLTTFFENIVSAHIIFALEKYRHSVEVTLHVNGKDFVGHDVSDDMYISVDRVAEKLERQIVKYKGKRYNKKAAKKPGILAQEQAGGEVSEPESTEEGPENENEVTPADPIEFPFLALEEAVERLKENGKEFSIFSNRVTKRLNVLFKREDGSIGILEA